MFVTEAAAALPAALPTVETAFVVLVEIVGRPAALAATIFATTVVAAVIVVVVVGLAVLRAAGVTGAGGRVVVGEGGG